MRAYNSVEVIKVVDVEWADGEGGGLRKSVSGAVSRVPFESVLPVRRFTSYRWQRLAAVPGDVARGAPSDLAHAGLLRTAGRLCGGSGEVLGDRGDVPGDGLLVLRPGTRARSVEMAKVRQLSGYRHPRNRIGGVTERLMDAFGDPWLLVEGTPWWYCRRSTTCCGAVTCVSTCQCRWQTAP